MTSARWGVALRRQAWKVPLVLVAGGAGFAASAVDLPAAWFIAPLLVGLAFALLRGSRPFAPPQVNVAILAIIGTAISASFQRSSLLLLGHYWLALLVAACVTLVLSLVGGVIIGRLGRLDPVTASLGALPGGASGMVAMSDDLAADPRLVAFMQYLRLLIVLLTMTVVTQVLVKLNGHPHPVVTATAPGRTVPWWEAYGCSALIAVVGAWAGVKLRLPVGALMGPTLLSLACGVVGIPHGALPPGVLPAAYLCNGLRIGTIFDTAALRRAGRLAGLMIGFTVALMLCCGFTGWVLMRVVGIDALTAYLATMPGGVDSSAITALAAGADVPFVAALQLVRVLTIVIGGPIAIQWLAPRVKHAAPPLPAEYP